MTSNHPSGNGPAPNGNPPPEPAVNPQAPVSHAIPYLMAGRLNEPQVNGNNTGNAGSRHTV